MAKRYNGNPSVTFKDSGGAVAWVVCDPTYDVKSLAPAAPGKAIATKHGSDCRVGIVTPIPRINEGVILRMKERDTWPPLGDDVPTLRPGVYSVYVSVGKSDGTPVIALPLAGNDGKRRYKIGTIAVE